MEIEVKYGTIREVSNDKRRRILEFNNLIPGFSIQILEIGNSPEPLGKHAHGKNKSGKIEIFTIIKGQGFILFSKVGENGKLEEGINKLKLKEGSVIRIPPFVGHTFYLEPGTKMYCFCNVAFDENDFIKCPDLVEENFKTEF